MPGTNKRVARTVAVVALVILLGAALRARLPGARAADPQPPQDHPATLLGVIALVSASFLVIAVAVVMSLREPRRAKQAAVFDVPGSGAAGGRRSWRLLLIGLAAILAWLALAALIAQFLPQYRDASAPPSAPPPQPGGSAEPRPPASPPSGLDDHVFWVLLTLTAALALLIGTASVISRRRSRRDFTPVPVVRPVDPDVPASGSESLALAAERGLAEVGDLSREPRAAIIACYAAMEDALANAPGAAPQESDTPSEVLARAVHHHAIRAESATELVDLFAEARFSTHVMNEGHRDAAERALRLVLDELRTAV